MTKQFLLITHVNEKKNMNIILKFVCVLILFISQLVVNGAIGKYFSHQPLTFL